MNDWTYFLPNPEFTYEICIFDDGNEKYKDYENRWFYTGAWRGKCELTNQANYLIKVCSISNWKINKLV
jgi:hypothetical protein